MDIKEQLTPEKLELFSFLWSEVRLVLAAVSLYLGTPFMIRMFMSSTLYNVVMPLLMLFWIVSGLTAGYLAYRWYTGGQKLFGEERVFDKYAFFVSTVSGLHLGIAGLTTLNIGMTLVQRMPIVSTILFLATSILYVVSALWLFKRWNESERKMFGSTENI